MPYVIGFLIWIVLGVLFGVAIGLVWPSDKSEAQRW